MKILTKTIKIEYTVLKFTAIIYCLFPVLLFYSGWLKWYFYLIAVISSCICLYKSFSKISEKEYIELKIWLLMAIIVISFAYAFFCGVGRLWGQTSDYPWRNAVFRDLILKDWPVLYEKYNGALTYYIGMWLPAAIIGKVFYMLGTQSETAFRIGNIALLIYVSFGLSVFFILLINYFKVKNPKRILIVIFMFIFFSGMDLLGSIEPLGINQYHLEWWAKYYQYSSFTTCMCWVFNQALIPWILMLIVLKDKKIEEFVFLGVLCLMFGPFPFIGLFVYCVVFGVDELIKCIKENKLRELIKRVFSISNIFALFGMFPWIGLYYLSNNVINGAGAIRLDKSISSTGALADGVSSADKIKWYLLFCLAEFVFYALMILRKYRKNYLFYVTVGLLFVFPFVKLGYGYDFMMRASIPSIFILFLMCVRFVFEEKEDSLGKIKVDSEKDSKKNFDVRDLKKYTYILLVIGLIIGAATPAVEFIRGGREVVLHGVDYIMTDYVKTLDGSVSFKASEDITGYEYGNFVTVNTDKTLFYKYICK